MVNDKVVRILSSMNAAGLRGHRPPAPRIDARTVARDVATAGCVLLKNSGLLPLEGAETIALLGRPAAEPAAGLGSSRVEPTRVVSVLDALQTRVGTGVRELTFTEGATIGTPVVVANRFLRPPGAPAGTHGVRAEFYANRNFRGSPKVGTDSEINVYTGAHAPRPGLQAGNFSVRYTATLTAPASGSYRFTITGTARLIIDGKTVVDRIARAKSPSSGSITLPAGPHSLQVDSVSSASAFVAQLTWVVPGSPEADPAGALASAVALAAAADVAVVVVSDLSGESRDRTTYSLPGNQDTLISQVAAANPRTIVVLTTSAPVSVENWIAATPAALWAGYHGQEGGEAVAGLLLGESNFSGKLPITWAKSANDYPATTPEQYPGVRDVETYTEGIYIGYRHFDAAAIEPRFPFGHGLSYTLFGYSALSIRDASPGVWTVDATVTNTGTRSGADVVQLYVGPADIGRPSVDMPPRQLKGLQRVDLPAGKSTQVSFSLTPSDLGYWNESAGALQTAPGRYQLQLGNPSGPQLSGSLAVS